MGKIFKVQKPGLVKKLLFLFEYSLKKRENKDNYIRLQKKPYIAKHT